MALAAVLALCGLVFGPRLPIALRVFTTGVVMFLGFGVCLEGRAAAPGLTAYTTEMALSRFFSIALLPVLSLVRLWPRRLALSLIVSAFPVSFALAALAAHIEENLFVRRYHESGVGPTARWTVSSSWLSYDAQTHRLDGSD